MRQDHMATGRVAILLGALVLAASSATVSAETCTRPQPPAVPSGANAEFDAMQTVRNDVDAYLERMQAYVDCLARENTEAAAEADQVVEQWNAALRAFENKQ